MPHIDWKQVIRLDTSEDNNGIGTLWARDKIAAINDRIVEEGERQVRVPAGTFDSYYLKLRSKKDGKETQTWINGDAVPVGGIIKTIMPGPMGNVTIELTAFERNQV